MIKIKNLVTRGEIYIHGDIISDTDASWLHVDDDGVLGYQYPAYIKEQLDELKGLPVDVHIASDGGDVAAGIAIYNMLAAHDAPVTVYIDSWAASIASVIAMAGQKIIMPESSFLMIHNPRAGAFGEADYLLSVATWLEKIKAMIVGVYATKSGSPEAEIAELMDAETWLTAREAAELFDVVEVVPAGDLRAVAQYRSGFDSAPAAVHAVNNIDNDETKNKIISVLQRSFGYEEKG